MVRPPITVLIADSQPMFAHAMGVALGAEPDLAVLPSRPGTGAETVDTIVRSRPDVALVDFWLPDLPGPQLVSEVLRRAPKRRVILLSWLHGPHHVTDAMAAGAAGFLPKSLSVDQAAGAVRQAVTGVIPYEKELGALVASLEERSANPDFADRVSTLTAGEKAVLANLSLGMGTAEMAAALCLSPATIKNRIHGLITKLGVRTRGEAVALARATGFLATPHSAAVRDK